MVACTAPLDNVLSPVAAAVAHQRVDGAAHPPVACAGSLRDYVMRTLGLVKLLERVEDDRQANRVTVPTVAVLQAVLCGFLLGIGSIRGMEDRLRHSRPFRSLAEVTEPMCDDTMRDVLSRVAHAGLEAILYSTARRELLRWGAGRYRECLLARRLAALNCSFLAAKAVVALDGHETQCSQKVRCDLCHTRKKTVKRGKELVEVEEYFHKIVVGQRIGAHPAVVLAVEPIRPGEGEQTAAYRLVAKLGVLYGSQHIGVIVADALHDSEPFRTAVREAGFRSVVRHKDEKRQPGGELAARIARRDPEREKPDGRHQDPVTGRHYDYWTEQEPHNGRRCVRVRRTGPKGKGPMQFGALVTDLPSNIPAMAAWIIMEMRWNQESGFHELAGQLKLDRAYVHKDRPMAVWAVVLLALTAYNVWQGYIYRRLGLDPTKPGRTWGDLRRDIFESLYQLLRRSPLAAPLARPP